MTKEMKLYVELTEIVTFKGIVYTPASPEEVDKIVENQKFIRIWERRIACHQIQDYWPRKVSSIQNHILSKEKDIQDLLFQREKRKKDNLWKWFESIEEIENYLSKKLK